MFRVQLGQNWLDQVLPQKFFSQASPFPKKKNEDSRARGELKKIKKDKKRPTLDLFNRMSGRSWKPEIKINKDFFFMELKKNTKAKKKPFRILFPTGTHLNFGLLSFPLFAPVFRNFMLGPRIGLFGLERTFIKPKKHVL